MRESHSTEGKRDFSNLFCGISVSCFSYEVGSNQQGTGQSTRTWYSKVHLQQYWNTMKTPSLQQYNCYKQTIVRQGTELRNLCTGNKYKCKNSMLYSEHNGQINQLSFAKLIGWSVLKIRFRWSDCYNEKGIFIWPPHFYVQIRLLHPIMWHTMLLWATLL